MPGRYYIGTSGWTYPHWREAFYSGIPQSRWLNYYAQHFNSVEVNSSFYRLPSTETLQHWYADTPNDFVFTLKANRYLTHTKRLKNCEDAIEREKTTFTALQDKLAVVLWQLPASFKCNPQRLSEFVLSLQSWNEIRHAIEFRHASWFNEEVSNLLADHNIAVCQSDAADWPMWENVTADFAYFRLHGHDRTYVSAYTPASLEKWAGRYKSLLQDNKDVLVYFDNDANAAAVANAKQLLAML